MKSARHAFAVVSLVTLALPALAAETGSPVEHRITGAAARELWSHLQIAETPIADEHGGPAYATVKNGVDVGCMKSLTDANDVECWYLTRR